MKAKLAEDILSGYKGRRKYGSKGDEVEIICWHDEVAIVEDKRGERFPARKERLTYDETETSNTNQA